MHDADYKLRPDMSFPAPPEPSLHSPQRRLIELRMAHADLDQRIDHDSTVTQADELSLRRLKKQRLQLRDQIAHLEAALDPPEPA